MHAYKLCRVLNEHLLYRQCRVAYRVSEFIICSV